MTVLHLLALAGGLVLLLFAGDRFVSGATGIADVMRLSPVVVGAVVLGFGTSAPEMVVSTLAAAEGDPALGVGNIVGSNVANLSLGMGIGALLTPIAFSRTLLRREIPLSVAATVIFALAVVDDHLARWEGAVLAALLVVALAIIVRAGLPDDDAGRPAGAAPPVGDPGRPAGTTPRPGRGHVTPHVLKSLVGLAGVLVGAQGAVWGSIGIAHSLGLSDGFVGFSVVALGTSLPELATVIAAAKQGSPQLVVGNLFGSNLFNSLAVAAAMGLVGAETIGDRALTTIGVGAMCLVAMVSWVQGLTRRRITRAEGVILLVLYAATMVLLGTVDTG